MPHVDFYTWICTCFCTCLTNEAKRWLTFGSQLLCLLIDSFSIASCKANASCAISFLHGKQSQRPHFSGPFNQNKWELPASDQPTCGEDEALIELLLDKAETAYWANAPTCCDRSRNVTSRCLAGRRGGRQEAWGAWEEKKKKKQWKVVENWKARWRGAMQDVPRWNPTSRRKANSLPWARVFFLTSRWRT